MTKCPLTRGVRLREVAVSRGSDCSTLCFCTSCSSRFFYVFCCCCCCYCFFFPGHQVSRGTKVLFLSCLERFSVECGRTKTQVIILTNHNRHKQRKEPIRIQSMKPSAKRGENMNEQACSILILLLIDWENGVNFSSQSQSDVKEKPTQMQNYFRYSIDKRT